MSGLLQTPPPVKFSFMLATNATALAGEIRTAQEAINVGLDVRMLQSRDQKRYALSYERAVKDADGKPAMINGEFLLTSPGDVGEIAMKLSEKNSPRRTR